MQDFYQPEDVEAGISEDDPEATKLSHAEAVAQVPDHERVCQRVSRPDRSSQANESQFNMAMSEYYSQNQFYLMCIDEWIKEARDRYEQMFFDEVSGYNQERDAILAEMRSAVNTQR